MSRRDGFEPGVPCWIDTWQADADAAAEFYGPLFGWEIARPQKESPGPRYLLGRRDGGDVAAIGAPIPPDAPDTPAWTTYVWVADVDETAARAAEAGGEIRVAPFDSLDRGRMAIIGDPGGAALGVWAPGAHRGAQVVNEVGAWAMSALGTPNPEAAKPFYGQVFGWEAESVAMGEDEVTLWRLPGFVGGEPMQPVPRDVVGVMLATDGPPAWGVGFWVDDARATAARAEELGGRIVVAPVEGPIGWGAILADPAGAVFSVTTSPVPAGS